MGYFRKTLERRTFSQDRYYILIKRQKAGKATFNELIELDEIVNRVPDIREQVIIENFYPDEENERGTTPGSPMIKPGPHKRKTFADALRSFFHRILQTFTPAREFTALY
ncbi:MAG: hypothetical protein ACXVIY_11015 [Mucilaginibacter sp.]